MNGPVRDEQGEGFGHPAGRHPVGLGQDGLRIEGGHQPEGRPQVTVRHGGATRGPRRLPEDQVGGHKIRLKVKSAAQSRLSLGGITLLQQDRGPKEVRDGVYPITAQQAIAQGEGRHAFTGAGEPPHLVD